VFVTNRRSWLLIRLLGLLTPSFLNESPPEKLAVFIYARPHPIAPALISNAARA
jgi:hypothetical protein